MSGRTKTAGSHWLNDGLVSARHIFVQKAAVFLSPSRPRLAAEPGPCHSGPGTASATILLSN